MKNSRNSFLTIMIRSKLSGIALLYSLVFLFLSCNSSLYNIEKLGAIGDAETLNTTFIQKAIDKASANGGGTVIIPCGQFLTGALFLKNDVELHLEKGARLLGSTNRLHYGQDTAFALISADHQHHISITGQGIIDGQGAEVVKDLYKQLRSGRLNDDQYNIKRPREHSRPELVAFSECANISVSGVILKNSTSWVLTFRNSRQISVDSLTVESSVYWNNDGIDVVNCNGVLISGCHIDSADDGICLKSEGPIKGICENITVENCTIRSSASGFKIGTGSHGGFKNITVRNLFIYDTYRSAVAIECVDGGVLENIDVRNITAKNTGNAIFIKLGHRNKDGAVGSLKKVYIGNLYAEIPAGKPDIGYPLEGPLQKYPHNVFPSSITGLPGHLVENVTLENIEMVYQGGGNLETAFTDWRKLDEATENEAGYPEFSMFGELPVWGFYVRHVKGLKWQNVKISKNGSDYRPAMAFNQVDSLLIEGLTLLNDSVMPNLILKNVTGFSSKNIRLPYPDSKGIYTWN
ncbi:MAG TPA: glycoside hydrolase family 28 [Marinilabiliales bacterium]|nr:glycoside hydrolase family 28 [Marinilabiliales bacterium]HBX83543.1 glycoside hydrolase family 28 [Marinilabiliales bacterium]HBY55158.1 glycoside hydrolase family 28 [Marinilabiliales bacterium]